MLRTQEVQKEREKALEELGITVEKNNVGVHTPKKASFTLTSYVFWITLILDAPLGQFGILLF
jgi:hypothetical protein